jgi:predicted membrane-bound dolichyl-phosphate-mannose-protein mannosyltransferase
MKNLNVASWYPKILSAAIVLACFLRSDIKDQPMKGWEIWAILGLFTLVYIGEELCKIRIALQESAKD